jgi:hypothetical protein
MMDKQVPVFRTMTGMIHARMSGSHNALTCNSRNRGFRGTPGTVAQSSLLKHKLCGKCFNVDLLKRMAGEGSV